MPPVQVAWSIVQPNAWQRRRDLGHAWGNEVGSASAAGKAVASASGASESAPPRALRHAVPGVTNATDCEGYLVAPGLQTVLPSVHTLASVRTLVNVPPRCP